LRLLAGLVVADLLQVAEVGHAAAVLAVERELRDGHVELDDQGLVRVTGQVHDAVEHLLTAGLAVEGEEVLRHHFSIRMSAGRSPVVVSASRSSAATARHPLPTRSMTWWPSVRARLNSRSMRAAAAWWQPTATASIRSVRRRVSRRSRHASSA